ncbi:hypothetical protein nbrc107696_01320 [Gordonia spumicola]|uniref:PE-PPE domain-containing protein n=1 Tax=Gordonia spumicola TaxID=589161 RepID=A0A7I9V2Q5_9ACTN|nr:PE-PPE domain-containing protein [Gordonia spumicola]GED99685.1 hypothetical protein nbrc107696_01320 [Gordonia spumicola]
MRLRGKLVVTTVAGIVAAGVPGQASALTDLPPIGSDIAIDGPTIGDHHDVLGTLLPSTLLGDAVVIVTPGTDDDGLFPRVDGIIGDRRSKIVQYPEALWPIATGKSGRLLPFFAPSYDESRDVAVDHNLQIMRAFKDVDRVVVYTGFSQGAEALGNAAEQAASEGLLGPNTMILLVSDPRGPWGLKSGLRDIPFSGPVMAVFGAESNGARDPAETGDTKVVEVIVRGDPVADWQWNPLRPASSLLVNGAGFLAIHAGTGKYSYAHLENLEHESTLYSAEGDTTYEVYDTYHPLALLQYTIAEAVGIPVSDATMREWDRQAERFYPLQEVSPATADPAAEVVSDAPAGRHRLLDDDGRWAEPDQNAARHRAPRHEAADDPVDTTVDRPAAAVDVTTESTPDEPTPVVEPATTDADPQPAETSTVETSPADTVDVPTDSGPVAEIS